MDEEEIKKEETAEIIDDSGNGKKTLSIAAMVLGLVGLIFAAIPCGILGVIFGVKGSMKEGKNGMATAGLVLGIIDLVVGVLYVVSVGTTAVTSFLSNI